MATLAFLIQLSNSMFYLTSVGELHFQVLEFLPALLFLCTPTVGTEQGILRDRVPQFFMLISIANSCKTINGKKKMRFRTRQES